MKLAKLLPLIHTDNYMQVDDLRGLVVVDLRKKKKFKLSKVIDMLSSLNDWYKPHAIFHSVSLEPIDTQRFQVFFDRVIAYRENGGSPGEVYSEPKAILMIGNELISLQCDIGDA